MRCVNCGRLPGEPCCAHCHAAQKHAEAVLYEREWTTHRLKTRTPERPDCRCHGVAMYSEGNQWVCRYYKT